MSRWRHYGNLKSDSSPNLCERERRAERKLFVDRFCETAMPNSCTLELEAIGRMLREIQHSSLILWNQNGVLIKIKNLMKN